MKNISMIKKIVNLIFEAFHLKQVKHEWRRLAGVQNPDSVAEHSLSAAQIWYILANMEWADSSKVVKMLIWHDIAETRIGDIHKIGARYISGKKEAEKKIWQDQLSLLPFSDEIISLLKEMDEKSTIEWKIAKDADYLEMAFQWKVYLELWHGEANDWIQNVGRALKTESGKQIWIEMTNTGFADWWKQSHLKKLPNN